MLTKLATKCVPMIFFNHQISTIIFENLPDFSIDACQIGYWMCSSDFFLITKFQQLILKICQISLLLFSQIGYWMCFHDFLVTKLQQFYWKIARFLCWCCSQKCEGCLSTFISYLWPNLAKLSYGWSPLHHKNAKMQKKQTSVEHSTKICKQFFQQNAWPLHKDIIKLQSQKVKPVQ